MTEILALDTGVDTKQLEHYESTFDVKFRPQTDRERSDFDEMIAGLAEASASLTEDFGVDLTQPASYFVPPAFLRETLTPEQVTGINEELTGEVAGYCLGIQDNLRGVEIVDNLERLTYLPDLFARNNTFATFSELPFHEACGDWAGKQREWWVRDSVATRLVVFGKLLESAGLSLHFEDAFRPVGVQEGLFRRRYGWTQDAHPDWTHEQKISETKSKTAVTPRLASHKAGAAIDATLRDIQTGEPVNIGHEYPAGGALVFPKTPFLTHEQWRNRQIFQVAAGLAGLTLYVGEDWHVSHGDNLASLDPHGNVRSDYVAKYGAIREFDRESGEILDVYSPRELDTEFSIKL